MTNGAKGKSGFATGVALVIAIAALAFFLWQVFYMQGLIRGNAPELVWTRAVYLFGAVEALAFAAAGYIWGKEVNRQRAEKAEARADKTQGEAQIANSTAAEVVAKAESLKKLAALKAGAQSQKAQLYGSLGEHAATATQASTQNDLQEIATLAQDLFP